MLKMYTKYSSNRLQNAMFFICIHKAVRYTWSVYCVSPTDVDDGLAPAFVEWISRFTAALGMDPKPGGWCGVFLQLLLVWDG